MPRLEKAREEMRSGETAQRVLKVILKNEKDSGFARPI